METRELNTTVKKVATKAEKVATKNISKNNINKEPELKAVIELENSELTDKQRLFCIYYVSNPNIFKWIRNNLRSNNKSIYV